MSWIADLLDFISSNEATLSGVAAIFAIVGVIAAVSFRAIGLARRQSPTAPSFIQPTASSPASSAANEPGQADASTPAAKPSVAVLPFRNISNDKENDYFADGLTEDIATGLSLSGHLSIKSRAATFGLTDQPSDLRNLARDLNVGYVIEGSVRPIADHIRISVQLIDASTGNRLWAEKFDRPAEKLFEIQDAVISGITSVLGANISKAESVRASALTPQTLSAWEAVQRASFYRGADGNSEEETNKSIEELRKAVDSEPNYAYAHSMLAWILYYRATNGLSDDPRSDFREADPHLKKGLALASSDPFNLNICGGAFGYSGRYEKCEELCKRALAIDPNFADAYFNLAQAYYSAGRLDEADEALDRVAEISPNGPMSRYYDWYRSFVRSFQGRDEAAEELQRSAIDQAPTYTSPYIQLAISLANQGRQSEATETLERVLRINPRLTPDRLAISLLAHPNREQGKLRLQVIRSLWPGGSQAP